MLQDESYTIPVHGIPHIVRAEVQILLFSNLSNFDTIPKRTEAGLLRVIFSMLCHNKSSLRHRE